MTQTALFNPRHITITGSPAYLPPSLRTRPSDVTIRFRFTAAERRIFRRRKPMPVSEWAEKYRVVTAQSSLPGPWKNATTPYVAGIMDASFFASVQEIVLCKSPQTAGTESVINCLGHAADRSPGPALFVFPDEITARENCEDRITPMFTASPALRELLTGRADDATAIKIRLKAMTIYMAWANSVSRLANKAIRYLILDETDKYGSNKKEADPVSLAEIRTQTFRWNKKIWKISSPTIEKGPIWQAMLKSQVIFEYNVRCPACLEFQVMRFGDKDTPGGIKWPDDERDPEIIKAKDLAWYECQHCQAHWGDHERNQAVTAGLWRAKKDGRSLFSYLETYRPRKIAFHLPSWLSPFVSISEIAAEFLKCHPPGGTLNFNAYKNFCNKYKAEPWLEIQAERSVDKILALRDDRPAGIVPGGNQVAALLFGADVHMDGNGIYYVLMAIGYGQVNEQWLVSYGVIDSFAALAARLWEHQYRDSDGRLYPVHFGLIDSRYRTAEVYEFCLQHRGKILPAMGQQSKKEPYSFAKIEYYPGTAKKFPSGMQRMMLDTNYFKHPLAGKLAVAASDPGAIHLHAETSETFAAHLCSEAPDENRIYQQIASRPNHYWDCLNQIQVAIDWMGVKQWPRPESIPPPPPKPRPQERDNSIANFPRPDWLNNR